MTDRRDRRVAVYPASFDPITNGHLDLLQRSARLFDQTIIAVGKNVDKTTLFTIDERIEMIADATRDIPNLTIDTMEGLLVDYVRGKGAGFVLRGLRALADFEYEFEMVMMNTHMAPDVETVFLMSP